jgi:hypothetical protein
MSIKTVASEESIDVEWERVVRQAVSGLRYGSVEVQVHEGRVVQVETRAKVRFDAVGRRPDHRRRSEETNDRADRTPGGAVPTEETRR